MSDQQAGKYYAVTLSIYSYIACASHRHVALSCAAVRSRVVRQHVRWNLVGYVICGYNIDVDKTSIICIDYYN
jgi:hypothetical protein